MGKRREPTPILDLIEFVRRIASDHEAIRSALDEKTWIDFVTNKLRHERYGGRRDYPTVSQIEALRKYREYAFGEIPERKLRVERYVRKTGVQIVYRETRTGKFVRRTEMERAMKPIPPEYRLEWIYRRGTMVPIWRHERTGRIREIPYT